MRLTVAVIFAVVICGHSATKMRKVTDSFSVFWTTDDTHVTFKLVVKTKGYVAFGFSVNGSLSSADLVVAWVDAMSKAHIVDCHCMEDKLIAVIDQSQDYQLLAADENSTHTVVRFRRLHDTCDHNDFPITNDTMRLVYQWHDEDPFVTEGHIALTGDGDNNRTGHTSVLIFDEPIYEVKSSDDVLVWKVQVGNFSVPSSSTTYWCSIHLFPEDDSARYFLGYNLSIATKLQSVWHHMSISQCLMADMDLVNKLYHSKGSGFDCLLDVNVTFLKQFCSNILLAWGRGASYRYALPDDISISFDKPKTAPEFFLMEVHYNNALNQEDLVDDTTVEVYLSRGGRPNMAAVMQLSTSTGYLMVIPPGQRSFITASHCPSECTSAAYPPGGITVFAVGLHTHLLGRKLRLRHFRNGTELPVIVEDNNYDFNYQQIRYLAKPVQVLQGDTLSAECVYDSTSRSAATFGGTATTNEMCVLYPFYYPKSTLFACFSIASQQIMDSIYGVHDTWSVGENMYIVNPNGTGDINVEEYILSRGPDLWKGKVESVQDAQWRSQRKGICCYRTEGPNPLKMSFVPSEYAEGKETYSKPSTRCSNRN